MINLILRVSFKPDILTTEIFRILNFLDSSDITPFTPMGDKPDLPDIQDNNVTLFSGLNTDIRCSYLRIGLSINTVCESLLTAGGIPIVKYNQWIMTYPIGDCWNNQGITGNKKGSTANATPLNSYYLKFYTNDKSNTNVNLFNILVQRRLVVNYSPDCLVLRFSDLSFFSQASITHAEKLEFSRSTLESISSSNSCGKRICFLVDLLFISPVAIDKCSLSIVSVNTPYTRIRANKSIDVGSHLIVRWVHTIIILWLRNNKTPQCSSTNGVSNHNVIRGNTMAMYKSTQTHPKFIWRFFSCQQFKYFLVEACNEQEARSMLPDSPCIFSAHICPEVMHG